MPARLARQRKREFAVLIVTSLGGCIGAEWRTTRDMTNISPVPEALTRALDARSERDRSPSGT